MTDNYMSHPLSKSIEGFKLALDIFAKYEGEGLKTQWFIQAEHDQLWVGDLETIPESSEDGQLLNALGWHADESTDSWSYFT